MNHDHEIQFAVSAIRQYISNRPNAADTAEGIHLWWINWPEPIPMSVTLAALEILEKSNEMETIKIGNRTIWRKQSSNP